jgi:hypothetical protein
MKNACFSLTVILMICVSAALPLSSYAAIDNIYNLTEITTPTPAWDGTGVSLLQASSAYGDESTVTYNLPWQFTFYGQPYGAITADTNGNIWFSENPNTIISAHSFSLANTGQGRVIAAWNDDLSSSYYGGVFIQSKTNPDRVVIEWQTETYTDEGLFVPNNFETILFPDGRVRIDYRSITTDDGNDSGSGISKGDGVYYDISSNFAPVPTLAATGQRSFLYTMQTRNLQVNFTGTGGGTITINPSGIVCNANYSGAFPILPNITLQPAPNEYSFFTGWTAGACTGTGNCIIAMTADVSATASFVLDTAHYVRIDDGSTVYYPSIQAAYDAASDGNTIKLWAVAYGEDLLCNRPVTVTFKGGYNSDYSAITGDIMLNGSLTITDGTVISDGLSIK